MFCSFCGNPVPNNAKHCHQCGKKLPVANEIAKNSPDTKSNITTIENLINKMQNMKILIIISLIIEIVSFFASLLAGFSTKIDITVKILNPIVAVLYVYILWKTPKLSKSCADVISDIRMKKKSINAGFLSKILLYVVTPVVLALDIYGNYFPNNFETHFRNILSSHISAIEIAICIALFFWLISWSLSIVLFIRFFKIKKIIYNTHKEKTPHYKDT